MEKILVGVSVAGFIVLFILIDQEQRDWEQFNKEHACKVVSQVDGSTFNTYGVDSKGGMTVGVASTPSKTGYLCNDGVTYYR